MPYRGFDPRYRLRSRDAAPKLETLLASNPKNRKKPEVYSHKLELRPQFSASAEDHSHTNSERAEHPPILFLRDPFSEQILRTNFLAPASDLKRGSAISHRLISCKRRGGVDDKRP